MVCPVQAQQFHCFSQRGLYLYVSANPYYCKHFSSLFFFVPQLFFLFVLFHYFVRRLHFSCFFKSVYCRPVKIQPCVLASEAVAPDICYSGKPENILYCVSNHKPCSFWCRQ